MFLLLGILFFFNAAVFLTKSASLTVQSFKFENLMKGQTATVVCAVLDSAGPFVFRWTKDGQPLAGHPLIRIQHSEEFSLLSLRSLDRSRTGNYSCVASSESGQGNYSAELIVFEPPEWTAPPEDVSIVLGETARVDCQATGFPEPTITWTKLQPDLKLTGSKIFNHTSLVLANVREEDAGLYQCQATNDIGDDLIKTIQIKIYVPPRFREDYELKKVQSSHSTALQCEVTGDTPLTVKWSAEHMTDAIETRHKVQETPLPQGLLSELFITRVARMDAGLYICTASNTYGLKERTIKLVVLEPPSPPSEILVKQIGSDEVTLRWTTPYSGNSPVIRYVLQYWKDTGSPPKLEEAFVSSNKTSAVLTGLRPGTPYVVRMMAENEFGQSTPSIPVKFITTEESPTGYPTDINVFPKGSHSLLIRWKAPSVEQRNGVIRGYDLGYRKTHSSESFSYTEIPTSSGYKDDHQEFVLNKLQVRTEYEVTIRAFNSAGKGPLSVPVAAYTRDKGNLATPVIWVDSTTATTISLRWSKFEAKDEPLEYKLYYRMENGGSWIEVNIHETDQDRYVLSDLHENTLYEICLKVFTLRDGRSNPSATVKVNTADPSSLRSSMVRVNEVESSASMVNGAAATLVITVSVVTSAVLIVCVVAIACVYVVRIKTGVQMKEEMGSRHLTEQQRSASGSTRMSGNFRYVDVNSRPLLWCSTPAPPPLNDYPSPYATLPLRCTPLAKRWQNEGEDGLSPAHSERSESLANQRLEQVDEKTSSVND